jgi:hypothetical protein
LEIIKYWYYRPCLSGEDENIVWLIIVENVQDRKILVFHKGKGMRPLLHLACLLQKSTIPNIRTEM